jgi:hypothetical protein
VDPHFDTSLGRDIPNPTYDSRYYNFLLAGSNVFFGSLVEYAFANMGFAANIERCGRNWSCISRGNQVMQ